MDRQIVAAERQDGPTPWHRAISYAIAGSAMNCFKVELLGLDYLLPLLGTIFALLGWRRLRRENGWFLACWVIAVLQAVLFLPQLVLDATLLRATVQQSAVYSILSATGILLPPLLYLFLWAGLRSLQREEGMAPHAGGAVAMLAWYAAFLLLALMQYSGLIIGAGMLVAYILILRGLFKLVRELDEAGRTLRPVTVRVPDRAVVAALLGILAVGVTCGYLFFDGYPMQWQAVQGSAEPEVEMVKEQLAELGFPEEVLADLTDEDVLACRGALRVVADVDTHPANRGRRVSEQIGGTTHIRTVYDVEELQITGVAVELPGGRWKILHHFLWTVDPGFHGTEAIQLWPAYRESDGWGKGDEPFTGRVLYDRGGQTYAAPYWFLGEQSYTSESIFWGSQATTDVFAAFSMPRAGERQRGYVSYTMEEWNDGYLVDAWINYTHQTSWMQYPVMSAMEHRMAGGWDMDGVFRTVQDALQFRPEEGVPLS